jgi:hypothetical protein
MQHKATAAGHHDAAALGRNTRAELHAGTADAAVTAAMAAADSMELAVEQSSELPLLPGVTAAALHASPVANGRCFTPVSSLRAGDNSYSASRGAGRAKRVRRLPAAFGDHAVLSEAEDGQHDGEEMQARLQPSSAGCKQLVAAAAAAAAAESGECVVFGFVQCLAHHNPIDALLLLWPTLADNMLDSTRPRVTIFACCNTCACCSCLTWTVMYVLASALIGVVDAAVCLQIPILQTLVTAAL